MNRWGNAANPRKASYRLLVIAITSITAVVGCKHVSQSELNDYSPRKTAYLGELVNQTVYIRISPANVGLETNESSVRTIGEDEFEYSDGPISRPGITGTNNGTNNVPQPESEPSFRLVEEVTADNPQEKKYTQQEIAEALRKTLAAEKKDNNNSDDSDHPYGYGYSIGDSIRDDIKSAAIGNMRYAIHGFSAEEIGSSTAKLDLTSFRVADKQELLGVANINSPEEYIKMEFSASVVVQLPKGKEATSSPTTWVPKLSDWRVEEDIVKQYAPCIDHDLNDQSIYGRLFYYFKPSKCNFAELNAQHKIFHPMQLKLSKIHTGETGGGAPEYKRIWEDGKLVATFVFGKYESDSEDDVGTDAFNSFVSGLGKVFKLKLKQVKHKTKTNFRALYQVTGQDRKTYDVDIQAVHVSEIGKIDYEIGQLVFGERIGKHDLFMYNGHSGYGNNIGHVEELLRPKDTEYVLFFLNGCYTYNYSDLDQSNIDVIANMKPSYFNDMAYASKVMLTGLLDQQDYSTILNRLPARQDPIVSGETEFCPVPKK